MNKYDFIDEMRKSLAGKIEQSDLEETIRYYQDYIDIEIKKGKLEEEVLMLLGEPRLLAKSILAANNGGQTSQPEYRNLENSEEESFARENSRRKNIPLWVFLILGIILIVILLILVSSVIWFLLPVLIPVVMVVFLIRWFQKNKQP